MEGRPSVLQETIVAIATMKVYLHSLHLNPATGEAAQGLWQPEYGRVPNHENPICM